MGKRGIEHAPGRWSRGERYENCDRGGSFDGSSPMRTRAAGWDRFQPWSARSDRATSMVLLAGTASAGVGCDSTLANEDPSLSPPAVPEQDGSPGFDRAVSFVRIAGSGP